MRNILVIEGRQSIGGGQIITKKVCDGLSEENNISVFIPGKENAISLYLSDFSQYHYKLKEYSRGKKQVKDYFLFFLILSCCAPKRKPQARKNRRNASGGFGEVGYFCS